MRFTVPGMATFTDDDLSGSSFERVLLNGATFTRTRFLDATFRTVNFSGATIRGAALQGVRMSGVELFDVVIDGDLHNTIVNGVDIAPLVEAELDRRMPDRTLLKPTDARGYVTAWHMLERRWAETLEHARTLPERELHRSVAGEWSFIQTLRHLNFASAAWVGRMVLGNESPFHPLDLPWDEAPLTLEIPGDRDATPSLDEVLAIRAERQAMVRGVIEALTDEQLDSTVSRTGPGWPQEENFPIRECLHIVLFEEWEHRLFAERDLAALQAEPAESLEQAALEPAAEAS